MIKPITLITGSTQGIGKQIGIDLLNQGHIVIFTGLHDLSIEKLDDELKLKYKDYGIEQVDFSNKKQIDDFCQEINYPIDNIIFNVGATCRKNLQEITIEEWNNVFNINLTYPIFMLQKLYNNIQKRIIFIGSISGHTTDSVSIPYGVSKGALEILTKYLAKEFASKKVTVNTIAPGYTKTKWHDNKDKNQIKRIENKTLLKRFAIPKEISSACSFIINNDYINGQTISVDGGLLL